MTTQEQKIEQIIVMAGRLMAALEADIAALKAGHPKQMQMVDPEMQRLSAIYAREVKNLSADAEPASPALRQRLRETMDAFRDLLKLHMRYVVRVRNVTEGLIQAVAHDVEKKRTQMRPYTRPSTSPQPLSSGAILLNRMV